MGNHGASLPPRLINIHLLHGSFHQQWLTLFQKTVRGRVSATTRRRMREAEGGAEGD